MKRINWKNHIAWFFTAWFISVIVVMIYTTIVYDPPSIQDFLGFGGLLIFAALLLVPFSYNPIMWLSRKIHAQGNGLYRAILLATIGNVPIYLLMLKQYQGRMSIPEAKLFVAGYIALAIAYGLLFKYERSRKAVMTKQAV